ncbi:MAG: universal stress protein [Bacteroidia bacterium]|jgi:nucleotide-binding universal stress UspA family protein
MKTILIPTDFSDASKNAIDYGVKLAKEKNAKLVLLHVFHIPVVATDDPVLMPSFEQIEDDSQLFLKETENKLRAMYGFTNPIESISKPGFLIDEIDDLVKEKNLDLIIMGITDAGKLAELVISSNSIGVIKKINCPTIIVPSGAVYRPIQTIVFACDIEHTESLSAIGQVKQFVNIFNARLMIFNMVKNTEDKERERVLFHEKFAGLFAGVEHSINITEGDDLITAINTFIDINNADLLIMLPQKHTFFWQLFNESSTKKMAFHSHIPLLAIHE